MSRESQHLKTVLAQLGASGETQMKDLAQAINVSPATLYSAVATALVRGEIVKRNEGRSVFYRLPDQPPVVRAPMPVAAGEPEEEEQQEPAFNAALWADGDLVLVGVELNADGNSITLAPDRVRLLCRLLHGQGPTA